MKKYCLLILCLYSFFVNAQEEHDKDLIVAVSLVETANLSELEGCEDGNLGEEELRVDCGGPDCPRCIPFLYQVNCDDEGFFTLIFALPDYWWLQEFEDDISIYSLSGDFNNDGCFSVNDCFGIVDFSDGTNATVRIELVSQDGEVLGVGQIDAAPVCVKVGVIEEPECADSTNFVVDATYIDNGDDFSYMVKLEMSGGEPPYVIRHDGSDYFYEVNVESDVFHIGAFPNGYELGATVYDVNGCSAAVIPMSPDMTGLAILESGVLEGCTGLIRDASLFPTVHNSSAQLSLNLREAGEVSLAVYDLRGAYVGSLLEDYSLPVGTSVVSLETGDLERGVYIYQLRSCEGTRSFKVIRD